MAEGFRTERDPLGDVQVPADAYYGVQTQRAVENFPISGLRAPGDLVTATILVKKAAAEANAKLGRLKPEIAAAIVAAADEILSGDLREQFVVDVYQAGAGTSHNMNANEVLANRASEILGDPRGTYRRVHPTDPVNEGQSTNDVYPTATRLALLLGAAPLVAAARALSESLGRKADEFANVLKTGRTHLQDAVPMTLGQEFGGYAACVSRGAEDVAEASEQLLELNIGATAIGTSLNAGEDYRRLVVANLAGYTTLSLRPATNLFRVTQSMGDVLAYSSAMRTTFAGSITPAFSRSSYWSVAALKPNEPWPERTRSTTTEPSWPALPAICRSGSSTARRTRFTPVASSPWSFSASSSNRTSKPRW